MKTRITIEQLEQMKTHELADLLVNVVLLLRRMPDVEFRQFIQQVPQLEDYSQPELPPNATTEITFTESELQNKNVDELKRIAKEMKLPTAKKKKADLVKLLLARSTGGRSEQFMIQDV